MSRLPAAARAPARAARRVPHRRDDAAPLVAQAAGFVEFAVISGRDEASVAGQQRGFGDERLIEQVGERVVAGQGFCGIGQQGRDAGQARGAYCIWPRLRSPVFRP
mgnify:CR=1 FL=1